MWLLSFVRPDFGLDSAGEIIQKLVKYITVIH